MNNQLARLIPEDIFAGTSLILMDGERFLYGLRSPNMEAQKLVAELTGIGGGIEPEDENLVSGVLREVSEEIACGVRLVSCGETLIVRGPGAVEKFRCAENMRPDEMRPAAIVFRRYRTPPHQPWHNDNQGEACLIVYLAELEGKPQPSMELAALLWLSAEQVVQVARRDIPLQSLLDSGARLVERRGGSIPATASVRLTDSHEALVIALGDGAQDFYQNLSERRLP